MICLVLGGCGRLRIIWDSGEMFVFLMNTIDQMTICCHVYVLWSTNDRVLFWMRLFNDNLLPQSLGKPIDFVQLLLNLLLLACDGLKHSLEFA